MTKRELGELIETDARDMNYSWSIVRAIAWNRDQWSQYPLRFVISFALADDAQRFVRWWHRRTTTASRGVVAEARSHSVGAAFDDFVDDDDDLSGLYNSQEQTGNVDIEISAAIIS